MRPLGVASLVCTAMLFTACLSPAGAQGRSDVVPRDLAEALLRYSAFGMGEVPVKLEVGRPADRLPASSIPPGAVVLGSVLHSFGSTTIAIAAATAAAVRDSFHARLVADGWSLPPRPDRPRDGGFQDRVFGDEEWPGFLCKGSQVLRASYGPHRSGGTLIAIHHLDERTSAS